jgi:GNAT superfamily N-acetyltransferase
MQVVVVVEEPETLAWPEGPGPARTVTGLAPIPRQRQDVPAGRARRPPPAPLRSRWLGWPEQQQDALIRMQFGAQTRRYRESFPDAAYSVICVDGEPAGRLIVNQADDQILIVDIALLPEFRHTGIGSGLVRRLLEQADVGHLPVRCHVLNDGTARRFWEHAGFAVQGSDAMYVAMERQPQVQAPLTAWVAARPAYPRRGSAECGR